MAVKENGDKKKQSIACDTQKEEEGTNRNRRQREKKRRKKERASADERDAPLHPLAHSQLPLPLFRLPGHAPLRAQQL